MENEEQLLKKRSVESTGDRSMGMTREEPEEILRYFEYRHLPPNLQGVSKAFHTLAHDLTEPVIGLPRCAERTVSLRKLLEAKDAAVRAAL